MKLKKPDKKAKPGAARPNTTRLDRSAWIAAADNLLIERGVEAVRIEPLAKLLSVTKGSFYWHFKDRTALLDAMLEDWHHRHTLAIIERLETSGQRPAERLHSLLCMRQSGERNEHDAQIELAIRLWARSDERARAVLKQTDTLRLRYFFDLFLELEEHPAVARAKAALAYSYMRVGAALLYQQVGDELRGVEEVLLS